jgi:hypothetical protein
MDALRYSKKNLPPSCSHFFFIHIFQFDLDARVTVILLLGVSFMVYV